MTVASVTLEPIKNLKGWYKLVFVSRKNGIGATTIELLFSEETLRMMRLLINQKIGENSHELPENFS